MKRQYVSVLVCLIIFVQFSEVVDSFLSSCSQRHTASSNGKVKSSISDKSEDENGEISSVSDAEALLACFTYLKRRKRLNWTQQEHRKKQAASAKPHYFWEEEDEETEIVVNEDDEEDDFESEGMTRESRDIPSPSDEIWFGEFTSFATVPSLSRTRRSQAAKKTWSDPEFRKRWYKSRWGVESEEQGDNEKALENRVRTLPSDFWGSDELAAMTEEEISSAIQTYVTSKKKRSASRKKTLQDRKPGLEIEKSEKRLPRDALFTLDQATLKEQQRKRSERAKKAYEKRLINKKEERKLKTTNRRAFLPTRKTPQDAILRIEDDLDRGVVPTVDDVLVIMKPMKLAKRKDLLRRILQEFFDLRGKCIPVNIDEPDGEKLFVTKVSIHTLGDFVVHMLQSRVDGADAGGDDTHCAQQS